MTGSAFFAVFIPTEWMASTHERLGLGVFPDGPVVEYLARSVAAFYGFHGVLLFIVAGDPIRFRPIVSFLAAFNILFGTTMVVIPDSLGFLSAPRQQIALMEAEPEVPAWFSDTRVTSGR